MEYFNILNLHREPFSNSPEPDLFFLSNQHQRCLQRMAFKGAYQKLSVPAGGGINRSFNPVEGLWPTDTVLKNYGIAGISGG
jgi:hypothetical protein